MSHLTRGDRGKARGFTLVELLVVIAIIGILASLLTPVLMKVRQDGFKVDCKNNLRQIASAAQMYASDRKIYPWPKTLNPGGTQPDLAEDKDARDALGLLCRYGYIDDARVYLCKAAPDEAADTLDTEAERRTSFVLEEHNCSFTWRKKLTTVNDDSRTPISGDKRGGDTGLTNHKDGRNVVFVGTNVQWFDNEKLQESGNRDTRRARNELIGFDRITQ
ncbi:MAG TPA: prepilin-type N-terminal cleavage/methylation domain-containing protein [Planctomycetota bacterium]|nr:prepilin-type N-terminal cleavage/methylation domain-containing protein [Planctomycetota bacterium]